MAKRRKDDSSISSSDSSDDRPKKAAKEKSRRSDGDDAGKGSRGGRDAAAAESGEPEPQVKAEASSSQRPPLDSKVEASLEEYKRKKIAEVELLGRAGGVYIPPFKLARMQKDIEDKTSPEFQRQSWEALRKSINGLVNKMNTGNIKNLVEEMLQENLVRGRGLLVRAVIRAQMASPGFTHVFAALVAVVNSKLPEIGDLLLRRLILQFRRAYKRNDKIVTTAVIKFMAHLVNQKVASELLSLHIATLLLERVTDDSIEICVSFMQECGQALAELSTAGSLAIFERFRSILHEGEIDKRVQYVIEGLFDVRRKKFADFPATLEQLDLVDEEDQITHEVDLLDDAIRGEETLNIFKAQDPEEYVADEAKWKSISGEILGTGDADEDGSSSDSQAEDDEQQQDEKAKMEIVDFTEQDMINLRRTIYLIIMSSVNYEECVHKILKLNITEGQENEVCTMLIDCCAMERMFNRFFPLQAQRLSTLNPVYQERFQDAFGAQFATVHRLETNKLRNIGKFFAHLLYTDAISWSILAEVKVTEETTTSSSRIFIKVIFQELSEQWGIKKLCERLKDPNHSEFFHGLFPMDHPKNVRFSINFFTAIGLGVLTEDLRKFLEKGGPQLDKSTQALAPQAESTSSGDSSESDSSSDSDSDSDSSGSSS